METESLKILGTFNKGVIKNADFKLAQAATELTSRTALRIRIRKA